jgi:hypothetical protein
MAKNNKRATFYLASLASVNTQEIWEKWLKITKNSHGKCQKLPQNAKNYPK